MPDNLRKIFLLIIMLLFLQSCMGTAFTRFNEGSFAGAYPYSAVAADVVIAKEAIGRPSDHGGGFATISIISIPLDLVLDTVLFPVDLVTWPFGYKKSWLTE